MSSGKLPINTGATPRLDAILINRMASVAKRLRQWIVVPPFVGSSPIVRPSFGDYYLGLP